MRNCFKCNKEFEGTYSWCPECKRLYMREYQKSNKDKISDQMRKWRKINPESTKNSKLKFSYNITLDQYNSILIAQNNCCAICKRHKDEFKRDLAVDHCHKTGKIRGLLCTGCNRGIAYLKDNIETCLSAIKYLNKS